MAHKMPDWIAMTYLIILAYSFGYIGSLGVCSSLAYALTDTA